MFYNNNNKSRWTSKLQVGNEQHFNKAFINKSKQCYKIAFTHLHFTSKTGCMWRLVFLMRAFSLLRCSTVCVLSYFLTTINSCFVGYRAVCCLKLYSITLALRETELNWYTHQMFRGMTIPMGTSCSGGGPQQEEQPLSHLYSVFLPHNTLIGLHNIVIICSDLVALH